MFKSVFCVGCLLMASVPMARASVILDCTAGADCDGNQYAVSEVSHVGSTYVLELDIKVTTFYTGSLFDLINSISLKNFVTTSTYDGLISAPGGAGQWAYSDKELDASGCSGGGTHAYCIQSAGLGAPLFSGTTPVGMLSWLFQFDSPDALADTATIKYTYVNSAGSKVGSLGSWDIAIQGRPVSTIPEPISMLLTGTGLVGVYFTGRRRTKKRSPAA